MFSFGNNAKTQSLSVNIFGFRLKDDKSEPIQICIYLSINQKNNVRMAELIKIIYMHKSLNTEYIKTDNHANKTVIIKCFVTI